jgi:hypothetical protein
MVINGARNGLNTLNVFGVHPTRPGVRFDVMGLLLLLQGGEALRSPRPAAGGVLLSEAAHV